MSMNHPGGAWPKLMRDAEGLKVTLRKEMRNGAGIYPAGTKATIYGGTSWHALRIIGEPCSCCGVQLYMSKVTARDLELVDVS